METQPPQDALKTALAMLPEDVAVLDNDMSHCLQGMCMGTAYLLERLYQTYYTGEDQKKTTEPVKTTENTSKKNKKGSQTSVNEPNEISQQILVGIQKLLNIINQFLIPPTYLGAQKITATSHTTVFENKFSNINVTRNTITALLEALQVLGESGALSDLLVSRPPSGPVKENSRPPLIASKQAFLHRIASYLPPNLSLGSSEKGTSGQMEENYDDIKKLVEAAIRTMVSICIGEKVKTPGIALYILKALINTVKVKEPRIQLSVGTALADVLLGYHTPFKGHWYQRKYPLKVGPPEIVKECLDPALNPDAEWLNKKLIEFLTPLPGQVTTRRETISAAIWCLAIVKRISAPLHGLIPIDSIIGLLKEKEVHIQCIGAACFGLIFDSSSEEEKAILQEKLAKYIEDNKESTSIYVELYELAKSINRPDLALTLFVMSISSFFKDTEHDSCLKKSLAKLLSEIVPSLLRRLGKNLAPALPQLVPQIYISRFVKSWPDLQRGMESIWRGLVVYADASNSSFNYTKQATHSSSEQFVVEIDVKNSEENLSPSNSSPGNADTRNVDSSLSYFYEEIDSNRINKHVDSNKKSFYSQLTNLIEAHFNAIVCDIKSLLGFISSAHNSPETNNLPQTNSIILGNSPTSQQLKDACCFAIVALCKHPSAERKLAGHLPALLAGLLMMIESSKSDPAPGSEFSLANKSEQMIPAEKACIAVQKMVLQVFENPSSREAAIFLFPGLLPVLIETTISMPFGMNNPIKLNVDGLSKAPSYLTEDSESKKLSLDIILAAVRVSNASSLRSILPILILAGLHTMAYLPPNRICSLIRQPIAAANAMNVSQISTNTGSQNQPRQGTNTAANRAKEINKNEVLNVIPTCFSREIQMAEILNICIRLIDDICLSELVITFTELIRLGGIIPDKNSSQHHCGLKSVSVSVAVCVLITQLAARCSWVRRHHSYIAPKNIPQGNKNSVLPPQLPINNINRLVNQTFRESTSTKRQTTNNSNSSQSSSSQSSPNVEKNPTESFTLATTRPEAEQKMNDSSSEMAVGNLNLAPYAGKLLAALLAALPGGSRHTDSVRIEMNRAVVSLLGFAKESTVAKLLNRVTGWYLDIVVGNGESEEIRYYHELACVTTLLTIVNHSHQVVQKHASLFLPIIFIAKQKEDDIFHNFERANYIMMFSLAGRMMAMTMNLCLANTKWKATEPWCVGMPMKNDAHLDFISMRNKWYVLWVDAQAVYMSHCHTTHSKYREATSQLEAKSEDEQDNQTAQSAIGENIPLETMIKPDNFVSLRNQTFVVKSNMFPAIIATIEQVICGPNQTMHWPIRTQAALALWSLSVSLIEANNSITLKWAEEANEELLLNAADLAAAMVSDERPLLVSKKDRKSISKRLQQKSTEITSENSSPEDAEKNEEDSSASTNKFNLEELHANHKAWVELARVTIASLKETKPWAGKIYIIRSAALLCFYACDRDLSIEEPKLLKDLFLACVNESRKKRALKAVSCMGALDLVSDDEASSYRVEAIFACSCVLEALDQGMQISIENDENEEFGSETSLSTKLITRLCRIILTKFNLKNNSLLPYNTKKEDDEKHKKPIVINKHLNDNELQVAMLTLTLLWPESRTEQDLKIFADLLEFLVTVIQEVSTDVQIATLHTLIEILNKVSPQDFETATRNGQDGASVDKLKRIMTVLIKQLESFSFQSSNFGLQEQSLKVLSAIVFHPNLITSFKEPIEKMICHFMKQSKSTATGLQDLAAQLHGKLQITKFY